MFIHNAGRLTVASLALAIVVSAAPVTFFGEDLNPGGTVPPGGNSATARTQFLANLTGTGTETFEGVPAGSLPPIALSFPGSSGSITATLNAASGGVCSTVSGNVGGIQCGAFGRFPTSGVQWLQTASNTFSVGFSSPVSAFGFYGTDVGDLSGQLTVTLTGGSGGPVDLIVPNTINAPDGALLFWGFVDPSNSYTGITFGNTQTDDVFGFDDLVIGDQQQVTITTPEPSTFLTMVPAFGVMLVGLRRRVFPRASK